MQIAVGDVLDTAGWQCSQDSASIVGSKRYAVILRLMESSKKHASRGRCYCQSATCSQQAECQQIQDGIALLEME